MSYLLQMMTKLCSSIFTVNYKRKKNLEVAEITLKRMNIRRLHLLVEIDGCEWRGKIQVKHRLHMVYFTQERDFREWQGKGRKKALGTWCTVKNEDKQRKRRKDTEDNNS